MVLLNDFPHLTVLFKPSLRKKRRLQMTIWRYTASSALCFFLVTPLLADAAPTQALIDALQAYRDNQLSTLQTIADSLRNDPLQIYPQYWLTLKALQRNDDAAVTQFLAHTPASILNERIRREWLRTLGTREQWQRFSAEWDKLPPQGRDTELFCYNDLALLTLTKTTPDLSTLQEMLTLPTGCNTLINQAAKLGLINDAWLWQRLRYLLASNYVTAAKQLAKDNQLNFDPKLLSHPKFIRLSTRAGKEAMLYTLERQAGQQLDVAVKHFKKIERALGKDAAQFAWGQFALIAARKLQSTQALECFGKANPNTLNSDQWAWWARSALRETQWHTLLRITQTMPTELASKSVWQYWQARALRQTKRTTEANALLATVSAKHSYYGLLALDELGATLRSTPVKMAIDEKRLAQINAEPAINRSLRLFTLAQSTQNNDLRVAAQDEWRWAMRQRSDQELLAAAELARRANFYDMAIYSAERTVAVHDFSLRFIMPYQELTQRYAKQLALDDTWVYGLIRQESRFIPGIRSSAGAFGLMQIMPSTARWVARKMGKGPVEATHDIETNLQLGMWYLKYVNDLFANNEVLATVAYNAGPARARAWLNSDPMEGAIYAETIPFQETRDYVQKVMTNASYYAAGIKHKSLSLKTRMGQVPGK